MNTAGLWYRVFGVGGFILALGIISLIFDIPLLRKRRSSKKSTKEKSFKKSIIITCLVIITGFLVSSFYMYKAILPNEICYEGYYEYSKRNSRVAPPFPVTSEYVFYNDRSKVGFYLDSYSSKEIFSEDLEEGAFYRIWYEKSTYVILKVEKIQ